MKSSTRVAGAVLATGLLLALSLGLKVLAGAPGIPRPGPSPTERLGHFLSAATDQPVEPVADGWRLHRGDCWMMAFPSGPLGTLDVAARSHAKKPDRVGYVHAGQVSDNRPTTAYAFEVIGYHLQRPFRPVDPPRYIVLVAPKACGAWPALPWGRFS